MDSRTIKSANKECELQAPHLDSATNHALSKAQKHTYITVLFQEYKSLIETLSQLDPLSFHVVHLEAKQILDDLKIWLSHPSADQALEIYWIMRRLKEKIIDGKFTCDDETRIITANKPMQQKTATMDCFLSRN